MDRIDQTIIEQMRETLIGKKVSVNIPDRVFSRIKGYSNTTNIVGVCNFFGYNEFIPGWDLQITIDRTPINNIKINEIEIIK
jgi:hypothetical protein